MLQGPIVLVLDTNNILPFFSHIFMLVGLELLKNKRGVFDM